MDFTARRNTTRGRLRRPRRFFLDFLVVLSLPILLSGCQIGYYLHSGYNQAKLANSRQSIDKTCVLLSSMKNKKQNCAWFKKLRSLAKKSWA